MLNSLVIINLYIIFFFLIIKYIIFLILIAKFWGLGIGDWGLGIGDWAQSPIPNHQLKSKK